MLVRITQTLTGSIDGIRLDGLKRGGVYDVGTSLANFPLASQAAEPVSEDLRDRVVAPERQPLAPGRSERSPTRDHSPPAEAADRTKRR